MTLTVSGSQITFNDNLTQNTCAYGGGFAFRNKLINGGFDIAQRGTSFTSTNSANKDDTYNLDRWYILSDGNDAVDITQTTTVPTGAKYSIGLDVETVNKKFGIAQIIENANCYDAIGGNVTLSFQARVSATTKLDNVKCAVVAWSGTADTVTSDIISAWNVEGTNPTLIANATYENTPANLRVTTSWATYSVTANVDTASTTNIIVFIWSDVTDTTLGDFLYVTNVQLEKGSTATSFDYRPYGQELALCQRYYETSYAISVTPGTGSITGNAGGIFTSSLAGSTTGNVTFTPFSIQLKVSKRAAATMVLYDFDGTANAMRIYPADAKKTGVTSVANITETGSYQFLSFDNSSATAITAGNGCAAGWTAAAEL